MSTSTIIKVSGMHCANCQKKVEKALLALPDVKKVDINLKRAEAKVTSGAEIGIDVFRQAVEDAGYTLEV